MLDLSVDFQDEAAKVCPHLRYVFNGAVGELLFESNKPARRPVRYVIFHNPSAAVVMVVDLPPKGDPEALYWKRNRKSK